MTSRTKYTWTHEDGYIKTFYKFARLVKWVRKYCSDTDLRSSVGMKHTKGYSYIGAWVRTKNGFSLKF